MQTHQNTEPLFKESDVVYKYTRSNLLEDGGLIDVSEMASEAGFKVPVALTRAVWEDCVAWNKEDSKRQVSQDEDGRLWDVLYMCIQTARHTGIATTFYFILFRVPKIGRCRKARQIRLKCQLHAGDQGEPVITIMMPDQD